MKKLSFRRRSALVESRFFSFGAILIAVGLVTALLRIVAPSTFIILATPALRTGTFLNTQIEKVTSSFTNTQALIAERDTLATQNIALSVQNKILASRVQDLVSLIGTSTQPVSGVVADVIARPPESPYDMLMVDTGTNNSIAVGYSVLADGGIPIGTISETSPNSARVILFSSPTATTTAWVGSSHIPIILKGAGAGAFIAHTPRGANIIVGDTVFVSGKGIRPIGTVERIDANPTAVMEILRIRPIVNIFSLTSVEIVP